MLSTEFTHPDDAAALKILESIPVLPTIMQKVMDIGIEQMTYGTNLASKIRLSPTQLPRFYNLLPPICKRLGISEPAFFLEMDPLPNASAFGDTYTAITINSGIVDLLTEQELEAALAHECGHILCRHQLYHTLAYGLTRDLPGFKILDKIVVDPVRYALLYWNRKSELSCDRVAAFICGPEAVIRLMSRLAGGPKSLTEEINLIEFAEQADKFEVVRKDGAWNKTLQGLVVLENDHPFTSVRVRELLRWVASDEYLALRKKYPSCPNCYKEFKPGARFCTNCGKQL